MATAYDPGSPTTDEVVKISNDAHVDASVVVNAGDTCHQKNDFAMAHTLLESARVRSLSPNDHCHSHVAVIGLDNIPLPDSVPTSKLGDELVAKTQPLLLVTGSNTQQGAPVTALQGRLGDVKADGPARDVARPSESRAQELLRQKLLILAQQSSGGSGSNGNSSGSCPSALAQTIDGRLDPDSKVKTKFKINSRSARKVSTIFSSDRDDNDGFRLAKESTSNHVGDTDSTASVSMRPHGLQATSEAVSVLFKAGSGATAGSGHREGGAQCLSLLRVPQPMTGSSDIRHDCRQPLPTPAAVSFESFTTADEQRCQENVQQHPPLAAQSSHPADVHPVNRITRIVPASRTPSCHSDIGTATASASFDIQLRCASSATAIAVLPIGAAASPHHTTSRILAGAAELTSSKVHPTASVSEPSIPEQQHQLSHKDRTRQSSLSRSTDSRSRRLSPQQRELRQHSRSPNSHPLRNWSPARQQLPRQTSNRCKQQQQRHREQLQSREQRSSRQPSQPSTGASVSLSDESTSSSASLSPSLLRRSRSHGRHRRSSSSGGSSRVGRRPVRDGRRSSPSMHGTRRSRSRTRSPVHRSSGRQHHHESGSRPLLSMSSHSSRRSSHRRYLSPDKGSTTRRSGESGAAIKKAQATEWKAAPSDCKPAAVVVPSADRREFATGNSDSDEGSLLRPRYARKPHISASSAISSASKELSPHSSRSACAKSEQSPRGLFSPPPGQRVNSPPDFSMLLGGSRHGYGGSADGVTPPPATSLHPVSAPDLSEGAITPASSVGLASVYGSTGDAFAGNRDSQAEAGSSGRLSASSMEHVRSTVSAGTACDAMSEEGARLGRHEEGSHSMAAAEDSAAGSPAAEAVATTGTVEVGQLLAVTDRAQHLESADQVQPGVTAAATASAVAAAISGAASQTQLLCSAGLPVESPGQTGCQGLSDVAPGCTVKRTSPEEKGQPTPKEALLSEGNGSTSQSNGSQGSEMAAVEKPAAHQPDSPPSFIKIDQSIDRNKKTKKPKKLKKTNGLGKTKTWYKTNISDCACSVNENGQQSENQSCCASDTCPDARLLVECSGNCACDATCANRRFKQRRYADLELFKTTMKGWGLRARQNMPAGQFALEYVGEIIDRNEFSKRTQRYAQEQHQHHYFMELDKDRMIDATVFGNESRFINHSCDPNCEIQKWQVGHDYRMGFFTCRPVAAGEELTFDYNLVLYGEELQKCHCGAPNCRGTIGTGKQISLVTNKMKKKGKKDDPAVYKYMSKTDLEITKLSEDCKSAHKTDDGCQKSLGVARLMMRAENVEQLFDLLQILQNSQEKCRRTFVTLRGLECIWCGACDREIKGNKTDEFRIQVVKALKALPVHTKNEAQNGKMLSLMQRWSRELAERNGTTAGTGPTATTTDSAAITQQAAGNLARPLAAATSEDSSTSAEEVALSAVKNVGGDTASSADDACSILSVTIPCPVFTGAADCGNSAALGATQPTEPAEAYHPEVTDPSTLSSNPSEAGSPTEQPAAILAGLLEELLDHWSKLKEVFRIPKKQASEDQQKNDIRVKTESDERATDDDKDVGRGYNQRKSRRDYDDTKGDGNSRGWNAACGQLKAGSARGGQRSYPNGRSSRLQSDGDRKRRYEPGIGGQRSHSRNSKSTRFSRAAGSALTREQTRRQFEADIRAEDLLRKVAHKDRTSSTSGEVTPVGPPSQPSGDSSLVLPAIAVSQPQPSAATAAAALPRVGTAGSFVSQQPVPGPFVDGNVVYGQSHDFLSAVPPPVMMPTRPSAAPNPPSAAAAFQQQLPVQNMPGLQHYSAAYATCPPPPPVVGGVFNMPPYSSVFGTSHGTRAYSMPPAQLPPAITYNVALGGSGYGTGPAAAAAYGSSVPVAANYNLGAVNSGYGIAPSCTDPARAVPPVMYDGNQYVQPPVMPQQPQMIQQSLTINRPGLQPGTATPSMAPQIRPGLQVNNRDVQPMPAVLAAPTLRREDDRPPPPPAPPRRDSHVLPPNWKAAQDSEGKTYYYHMVTRQTQWEVPTVEPAASADPGTPTVDEPKQHKKSSKRTTRAAADTSSAEGTSRRLREIKQDISLYVRSCLNAYMRPTCRVGRIENKDDYKHLAQKLTHGIMEKESKQCERLEDLEVNDLVRAKTKAYIKNYMEKFGEAYHRSRQDDV